MTGLALVRSDVCVRADVLLQHAGFLTTNPAFLTDILSSSSTTYIHIVFSGLETMGAKGQDLSFAVERANDI